MERLSAQGNLRFACGAALDEPRMAEAFAAVGLTPQDVEKPVGELSGGQRRRVALLRALLAPADVVDVYKRQGAWRLYEIFQRRARALRLHRAVRVCGQRSLFYKEALFYHRARAGGRLGRGAAGAVHACARAVVLDGLFDPDRQHRGRGRRLLCCLLYTSA